jgi:hypothetical protein
MRNQQAISNLAGLKMPKSGKKLINCIRKLHYVQSSKWRDTQYAGGELRSIEPLTERTKAIAGFEKWLVS